MIGRPFGAWIAVLILVGPSPAQQPDEAPSARTSARVKPVGRVPEGVEEHRDIDYVGDGQERHRLDLYIPEGDGPFPVVAWIHGGGWQKGSKDNCRALPLAARGFAVASVNYRLTDSATFPAQIEDCRAAIRWLRANAGRYHLDPDRIGVWGSSAGGHLVALLGTAGDESTWDTVGGHRDTSARVQAVCDYFGPSDFLLYRARSDQGKGPRPTLALLLGGPLEEKQEEARLASPVSYASEDDPAFLIVHGEQDPLVPIVQSERLLEVLQGKGVEATLLRVKNGKHGTFTPDCEPRPEEIVETVASFFERQLKGDPEGTKAASSR